MNNDKVDLVIQYSLMIASQEEGFNDRYLGPIHELKYLYLADVYFSQKNDGETYTGIEWQFYNFGPWSAQAYNRIEPALAALGAEKTSFPSKYESDAIRWTLSNIDEYKLRDMECKLGLGLSQSIKKSVHKFTSNTESLLDYVYKTVPMLKASPGEILDFKAAYITHHDLAISTNEPISKRKIKLAKELKARIKEKIQSRSKELEVSKTILISPPPIYDEVFFAGQDWLDSLAGAPIEPVSGELIISEEIWKSKARFDDEVS